jgi:hypothetical protein
MPYRELDTIVLNRDLPEKGLHVGDLGAVLHVYEQHMLEVHFTPAGGIEAIVQIPERAVRPVRGGEDVLSMRSKQVS